MAHLEEVSPAAAERTAWSRGDRDRSAQGVVDRGRGERGVTAVGDAAGCGQPRRLPVTASLRPPLAGRDLAIEGATGLAAPLTARLSAEGIEVVDVPAKLAARPRMLSTGHGRKNDDADATSVGIAALTATGLRSARVDEAITALRALVEHHDDLIKQRTQTINRLHVLLTNLVPAGAPTHPECRRRHGAVAHRAAP